MALAVALVALLWYLSSLAQASDQRVMRVSMQLDPLSRQALKSTIFEGYADGLSLRNRVFDTVYSMRANYLPLGGNGAGGVSGGSNFSYSFWAVIKNPMAIAQSKVPLTLLLKGDAREYSTWALGNVIDTSQGMVATEDTDVLVKCPLIKLQGNDRNTLDVVIDLNMSDDLNARVTVSGNPSDDPTMRDNIMSLAVGSWSLWTLCVTDHVDENKRIVGTVVNFYMNDLLLHTHVFPGKTPIPNIDDLRLFPPVIAPGTGNVGRYPSDEALGSIFLADLVFTSPSMALADIQARVALGVPNKVAVISGSRPADTTMVSFTGANIVNMANP